jgi:hypothetical protein
VGQPGGERTVSVRLIDETGWLLAQQDAKPSQGARPTSWWEPGWALRDVYYLTLPAETSPGTAALDILLYDSFTQERVLFAPDQEKLRIVTVQIR